MLYSQNLLQKYINIKDDIKNIADNLTMKSCEIEEIISREIPKDIVVGKVTEVTKHPDADKLLVCQLDCADKWKFQIVTWWENVAEGYFVPVALPGAYIASIDLKIVPRQMRGLDSNGMICSKNELWIAEDTDEHWIWLMDKDLEMKDEYIGKPLVEVFPWLENKVLDVDNKTLTHRPDLTGHFGIATELNAIYIWTDHIKFNKAKDYMNDFQNQNIFEVLENATKSKRSVISESDKLNTYILLELNDVKVEQSNFFTRLMMMDLWMNPRENWVDFSNIFVSLSGQPIHFFDADKVDGDIIVRHAKEWEKFIDLFEDEHELKSTDLVIADKSKVLALAGVVGGKDSGVTKYTKNILVEIANFDPVCVRKLEQD